MEKGKIMKHGRYHTCGKGGSRSCSSAARAGAAVIALGALMFALSPDRAARADDVLLFTEAAPPNILWLIDTSGSMYGMPCSPPGSTGRSTTCNAAFFDSLGYDNTKTYAALDPEFYKGESNENTLFRSARYYQYRAHNSGQSTWWNETRAESSTLTDLDNCDATCETSCSTKGYCFPSSGDTIYFKGNFLNFYPPKYVITRKIMKDLINIEERVRMGLMIFDAGDPYHLGGQIKQIPPAGEPLAPSCEQQDCARCVDVTAGNWVNSRQSLISEINNQLKFQSWTPLAEALFNAGQMFSMSYKDNQGCTGFYCDQGWSDYVKPLGTQAGDIGIAAASNFVDATPYRCSFNAVVIMTDGSPTYDENIPCELRNYDDDCREGLNNHPLCTENSGCPACTTDPTQDCERSYSDRGSDYLDDVAKYLYETDLIPSDILDITGKPFEGIQNVVTYVIGFAVDHPLLQDTAENGDGLYITAHNYEELVNAFRAILFDIIQRARTFSVPLVPTVQSPPGVESGEYIYISYFVPSDAGLWTGRLQAFQLVEEEFLNLEPCDAEKGEDLNNNGTKSDLLIVDEDFAPVETGPYGNLVGNDFWDAGEVLTNTSADERNIYTFINGSRIEFKESEVDDTDGPIRPSHLGFTDDPAGEVEAKKLINWLRGTDAYDDDGDGNTTDEVLWKLGDIFHSVPIMVGPPSDAYRDPSGDGHKGYSVPGELDTADDYFAARYSKRQKVVYIGANDGMLHAFHAGDYNPSGNNPLTPCVDESETGGDPFYDGGTGKELFAFIPPNLLPKLKELRDDHRYMVDGSCRAAAIWVDDGNNKHESADEWRTVLVCAQREGGGAVFALDITDPTSTDYPKFLWEFTDANLGDTWSDVVFTKLRIRESGEIREKWLVVFGGGYDAAGDPVNVAYSSVSTVGKGIFLVDAWTGNKVWEFTYNSSAADGRQLMKYAVPSVVSVVDQNFNFWDDTFYVGDLGGQMWKFSVGSVDKSKWSGRVLFDARDLTDAANPVYRPIYFAPAAAYDAYQTLWVFFGTGDRNDPKRCDNNDRAYAVMDVFDRDTALPRTFHEADLVDASAYPVLTDPDDLEEPAEVGKYGWYLPLLDYEKIFGNITIFGFSMLFTTNIPLTCGAVVGGGQKQSCADRDPCKGGGGGGYLYTVDYTTGRALEIASSSGTGYARSSKGFLPESESAVLEGQFVLGGAARAGGEGTISIGGGIPRGAQLYTTGRSAGSTFGFKGHIITGGEPPLPLVITIAPSIEAISPDFWIELRNW